jgi:chemotaxis protein MotB
MRTIAIVILAVILAAALVSGIILYRRSHDARAALQLSEERIAELSAKLSKVGEETATLRNQITELEGARTRVSELEHAITQKDHAFSELNTAVRTLTGELDKEREITEQVTSQLTTRNAMLTELEDKVQGLHATIRSLKQEVARSQRELEELQGARERIAELQKRLRDAQSRERHLKEHLAEKDQELKGVDGRLRTLRGEKASAEASIDELRSTYESLIAGLKERIEQQEVTIERFEQEISVTFVDRILFEFGKAAVSPEGEEVLRHVGQILKGVEDRKIRVVGHTDDRPIHPDYRSKFPSNWELSSARASAVIHYFQKELDLSPTHLEAVGRSFYDPIASNETAEGRAKNRRVEIIIAPQIE